jgi:hypothetical protein
MSWPSVSRRSCASLSGSAAAATAVVAVPLLPPLPAASLAPPTVPAMAVAPPGSPLTPPLVRWHHSQHRRHQRWHDPSWGGRRPCRLCPCSQQLYTVRGLVGLKQKTILHRTQQSAVHTRSGALTFIWAPKWPYTDISCHAMVSTIVTAKVC